MEKPLHPVAAIALIAVAVVAGAVALMVLGFP
jgi:hypothetical protein